MNNGIAKIIIIVIIGFVFFKTCSSCRNTSVDSSRSSMETWEKSPVDKLIQSLSGEDNFTIILTDMDSRDGGYYHQYNVVVEKPDTILRNLTGWEKVTDAFFATHVDNMGMEIVSKKDGQLNNVASPAGYSNYVGNPKYGQWQERNGSSFWEFYGRYAFMSSMFNMMSNPVRRDYYNDYRGGYYGSRPYYGSGGNNTYGTKSYTASGKGQSSTWGSKPSSFKSNVRSQVSRSASSSSSRSYSSGSSYGSKKTRSSSRYSSSSSRGRSGGSGK